MKGPSDALPNTLSLGGSIRTRLTETALFTAFPTVVQFPSPPLWEAAGFSCLQTRCTFLSDISASSPGPPGWLETAQLHLEENKHQVPIVTQMLEDHLHTHVCWVSFFSNGKSWSIFKLQRRLSNKNNFPQQPQWNMGSRPSYWWDGAAHPSSGCIREPGAGHSARRVWCLSTLLRDSKGTRQAKGRVMQDSGEQDGSREPVLYSCSLLHHTAPLDKSHNLTAPLFPAIKSGWQPASSRGGRLDKCTNYHQTPHPAGKKREAIYLPKNLAIIKLLLEKSAHQGPGTWFN